MAFTWVSLKTPTVIQSMNFKSLQSANLKKNVTASWFDDKTRVVDKSSSL